MRKSDRARPRPIAGLTLLVALATGCASTPPTINLDSDPTDEGLYEVTGTNADEAWGRPGVDMTQYSKIVLDGITIEYRPGGETQSHRFARSQRGPFEVTEQQRRYFRRWAEQELLEELGDSKHFALVEEADLDALHLNLKLLDFLSYIPPDGPGGLGVTEFAEATLVIELRDSRTEELVVRVIDRRAAEVIDRAVDISYRFDGRMEPRRMFTIFAEMIRKRLDELSELGT